MPCTVQCVPVTSRWISQIILTANCTLAVWFKNGFCCDYFTTNRTWFEWMLVAPSKGHFVRQLIYKKLPYRPIRPPCPPIGVTVGCCANQIPRTLYATVSLAAGSQTLTYDGSTYWASPDFALTCGNSIRLRFRCFPTGTTCADFSLEASCNAGSTWWQFVAPPGCSCHPISVPFSAAQIPALNGCGTCELQAINATVTT